MSDPRFAILVERYLDREATAEELAELQALLSEDPQARERYWELAEWHALFRQWGEQEWGRDAANAQQPVVAMPTVSRPTSHSVGSTRTKTPRRGKVVRFPVARWAAGIAVAAAAVVLILTLQSPSPVATLDRVADITWKSGKFEQGARLKPGLFQLEKGAAVIAFDRGARVVIEGPADFEVRGNNSMRLRSGRVRAQVPEPAHGFKLETPSFTAVDIGTEFGCKVASDGIGELHVFDGKVDLLTGAARESSVQLSENQAIRVEGQSSTPLTAQPLAYLSETEMARRELRQNGDPLGAWRMASRQLDEHPATLLHLDFEETSGAEIPNRAKRAPIGSNAKVINGISAQGRWPGKSARTFQTEKDRLAFELPGQFESLTLLAWVRTENIHEGKNSLVMTRGSQIGEVHWYIYGNGALGVGVLSKMEDVPSNWRNFLSEPVMNGPTIGSWVFVATVLDGTTGTATHYFNGEPIGSQVEIVRVPLRLATADVGAHDETEPRKPSESPSNLDGTIDELAVLSTALTPADVARLYLQGKPGLP